MAKIKTDVKRPSPTTSSKPHKGRVFWDSAKRSTRKVGNNARKAARRVV
jgi:hypothetical protein